MTGLSSCVRRGNGRKRGALGCMYGKSKQSPTHPNCEIPAFRKTLRWRVNCHKALLPAAQRPPEAICNKTQTFITKDTPRGEDTHRQPTCDRYQTPMERQNSGQLFIMHRHRYGDKTHKDTRTHPYKRERRRHKEKEGLAKLVCVVSSRGFHNTPATQRTHSTHSTRRHRPFILYHSHQRAGGVLITIPVVAP